MQKKWIRIAALIIVTACLIVAAFWSYRAPPEGQHTVPGPGPTSLASEGLYVAEHVCAECHPKHAEKHLKSGHADTFRLTSDSPIARQLAGQIFQDPERGYSYHYHLDRQTGLSVTIPDQIGADRFPLPYEFGSGHNAVTFLTLLPDRWGDTVAIEHRISLYRGEGGWELDLTPGHQQAIVGQEVEQFGRVIRGDTLNRCIGCHTIRAELSGSQLKELLPHVGCQSCHGPGHAHVVSRQSGGNAGYAGFTKQTAIQEIELCGRCHRLPEDRSNAHVSPNIIQNIRFQPAGLIQSKCFTASDGLRCSTCHDPHEHVSRDRDHYVTRCLTCHGGAKSTVCPVSPRENCIPCHMPATAIHREIKFHDHWIRVRRVQATTPQK